MKKILIITGSVLGMILIILLLIPVFLQNNITRIVNQQINKYTTAKVEIGNISLSMFKAFPNLQVHISDLIITTPNNSRPDTLLQIPLFKASVNLLSVLQGNDIKVNHLLLKNTLLRPSVTAVGQPNWNIFKFSSPDTSVIHTDETSASYPQEQGNLELHDISIENLDLIYTNLQHATRAEIKNLNLRLNGQLNETHTLLNVKLDVHQLSFIQGEIAWIDRTRLNWTSKLKADLKNNQLDILDNELMLNDLKTHLQGNLKTEQKKCYLDLQLTTPDTHFENLLSLIPSRLLPRNEKLETKGEFTFRFQTKGWLYAHHLPQFEGQLSVKDGYIHYTDLPESIKDINLNLHLWNPGGIVDSTTVQLEQMTFHIAGNPFRIQATLINPQDPFFTGKAQGIINLALLPQALPLQTTQLDGIITTDVNFNGRYAYIENQEYEKFKADGFVKLRNFKLQNTSFPQGLTVPSGAVEITPSTLKFKNFEARINSSDFILNGNLSNYLPYFFKGKTLNGTFTLNSQCINLNEFLQGKKSADSTTVSIAQADSSIHILTIPSNLNLQLHTEVEKVIFDRLLIQHIKGKIGINSSILSLHQLHMNLLNGSLIATGNYSVPSPSQPSIHFDFAISDLDLRAAYQSFSYIKKNIPIAMNCEGVISSQLQFSANLNKTMDLIPGSINGRGYISSEGILINDNPTLQQLASLVNNNELSRLSISQLRIDFLLDDGNLQIQPFHTKIADNRATISGRQYTNGDIDYNISLDINRRFFGKDIDKILKAIPGSNRIESLEVDVNIYGTLEKPIVKPDLSKAIKSLQQEAAKELKNKAKKGLLKELQKLF